MPVTGFIQLLYTGRDSAVDIASRYGLDGPRIGSRKGVGYSAPVQADPVTQPASFTIGTGSFLVVKKPARSVDHPPPNRVEVKE
jgi:hypothetical protein